MCKHCGVNRGGLPETCSSAARATLWLWAGHAVYRGSSLRLDVHSGSVECLAVGVDAPFTLQAEGFGERPVRSALIPARVPNRIGAQSPRMLFCYFDPGSALGRGCHDRMRESSGGIGTGHLDEAALITAGAAVDIDPRAILLTATGRGTAPVEARIAEAMRTIRADPAGVSASESARAVHLSTSRFLHLFSAQADTSFRRYRLWARMLYVGSAVSKGQDFTTAAVDAGFASPSHFSDAFHAMFGLTPTALLAGNADIVVFDE